MEDCSTLVASYLLECTWVISLCCVFSMSHHFIISRGLILIRGIHSCYDSILEASFKIYMNQTLNNGDNIPLIEVVTFLAIFGGSS